jgi:hypothetical protein
VPFGRGGGESGGGAGDQDARQERDFEDCHFQSPVSQPVFLLWLSIVEIARTPLGIIMLCRNSLSQYSG